MISEKNETRGENMPARADRLIQAREFAKYDSANAAALRFGWPASTYRAHENGTRNYKVGDAHRYAEAFGVNFDWLWHGKGKMVDADAAPTPQVVPPMGNVAGRAEPVAFPARRIPVYGHAMGGLEGALILDNIPVDQVECLPGLEFVPDAYAVYVIGDSMAPRYLAGECVYVHPAKQPRKGDYVVVQVAVDGEPSIGYVKQFVGYIEGSLVLSQLNPPTTISFEQHKVRAVHKIVGSRSD